MKAAILESLEHIVVRDVPEPQCGENEAILKVEACAVCGSDIRIYHYGSDRVNFPAVMGHEIAGQIVQVGKNVTRVQNVIAPNTLPSNLCAVAAVEVP